MKNHENWPGTLKYHPWTLNNHKNPPGTIKNRPGTLKNHKTWPRTMKNHKNQPRTMKNQPGWLQETPRRKWWFFVTDRHFIIIYISPSHCHFEITLHLEHERGHKREVADILSILSLEQIFAEELSSLDQTFWIELALSAGNPMFSSSTDGYSRNWMEVKTQINY